MSQPVLTTSPPEDVALWREAASAALDAGATTVRPDDQQWQKLSALIGADKAITHLDGSSSRVTPDSVLRAVWLDRVGPHAWIAQSRAVSDPISIPITLRPGTPTNTITQVCVALSRGDQEFSVDVALFPIYRQQWTLDLTIPIPSEVRAIGGDWQLRLHVTDADQRREFTVTTAPDAHLGFFNYPSVPISGLSSYVLRLTAPDTQKSEH